MRLFVLALSTFAACTINATCNPPYCEDCDEDSAPGDEDSAEDTSHTVSGDTGGELEGDMTIKGTVSVQVYEVDGNGEMVLLSWDEAYDGLWNYGNIFVGAYNNAESGDMIYYGDTAISSPSVDGDPYEMRVRTEDIDSVNVYAALDFYGEGVIGSGDPIGMWPDPIAVVPAGEVDDVDITIMALRWQGGGGGCTNVSVNGQVVITVPYAEGNVGIFANDTSNNGPRHASVSWVTPVGGSAGALADYSLTACVEDGPTNLVGGWDTNGNGMLDPVDRWGAYISEADTNGNPITIGSESLYGYDVQIPLGDHSPFNIVPFVRLGGNLSLEGGASFSTLPAGSTMYVTALKYRPDEEISVDDLDTGYDLQVFEWDAFSAASEVVYSLKTPANSIAYLWAYIDTDNDGLINESGEPVGSGGGNANGRVTTGEESQDSLNIALMAGGGTGE